MSLVHERPPSAEEAALAKISSQELSAFLETQSEIQSVCVTDKDGAAHDIRIPTSAMRLLVEVLTQLGEGNTVNLIPVHAEMTTQEAADILNVSRPTLIKYLDNGLIPFHQSGNRRKVMFVDVMAYKSRVDDKRRESLAKLAEMDQELGLGY